MVIWVSLASLVGEASKNGIEMRLEPLVVVGTFTLDAVSDSNARTNRKR